MKVLNVCLVCFLADLGRRTWELSEAQLREQYMMYILRVRNAFLGRAPTPHDVVESAKAWKVAERFSVRPLFIFGTLWSLRCRLSCVHAQQCKLLHFISAFAGELDGKALAPRAYKSMLLADGGHRARFSCLGLSFTLHGLGFI